eukprot:Sspe_Gene.116891::Locus_107064_Transcript_1_1_Confidence_1.000_Length_1286::g.116891::m.116891
MERGVQEAARGAVPNLRSCLRGLGDVRNLFRTDSNKYWSTIGFVKRKLQMHVANGHKLCEHDVMWAVQLFGQSTQKYPLLGLLEDLKIMDVSLSREMCNEILRSMVHTPDAFGAMWQAMVHRGFPPDNYAKTQRIRMLAMAGELEAAKRELARLKPGNHRYYRSALTTVIAHVPTEAEALSLLPKDPDTHHFNALLRPRRPTLRPSKRHLEQRAPWNGVSAMGDARWAERTAFATRCIALRNHAALVARLMDKARVHPDAGTYSTLLTLYKESGDLKAVREAFSLLRSAPSVLDYTCYLRTIADVISPGCSELVREGCDVYAASQANGFTHTRLHTAMVALLCNAGLPGRVQDIVDSLGKAASRLPPSLYRGDPEPCRSPPWMAHIVQTTPLPPLDPAVVALVQSM